MFLMPFSFAGGYKNQIVNGIKWRKEVLHVRLFGCKCNKSEY
jgi:hypothetical protein